MVMALEGIRVLDVSNFLAGPTAAQWLGDFGAEVIKLEHKRGDGQREWGNRSKGHPLFFKMIGRNKKCATLNLSSKEGQELFRKLVPKADIIVENFRPGTMAGWGLAYDELQKINPRIIMMSISAYGQDGPYAQRPGLGTLAEAISGYADITGQESGPPTLPGFGLADSLAGITGAFAILAALQHRNRTGEGQYIDVSLYEPLMSILGPMFLDYDQLGLKPKRLGSRLPFSAPRNVYLTKDNRWIAMSSTAPSIYDRTMRVLGLEHLIDDERFATNAARSANVEELDEAIGAWVAQHTLDEAMEVLVKADAAAAPVYSVEQIFEDPQVKYRESIVAVPDPDLGHVRMQNIPVRMSKTPPKIRFSGRKIGADTDEIYSALAGVSDSGLADLKERGII